MPSLTDQLSLYLVADPEHTGRDILADVAVAVDGGVTAVQLRAKQLTDRSLYDLAARASDICKAKGALFLVNDRVDIAQAVGADGVHLGVEDFPVAEARRLLGPEAVIGFSPDTDDATASAGYEGASYLGVGPIFGTTSKIDAGESIGVEVLRRRVELARVPVIGIGGITEATAGLVIGTGAVGVAVISAILHADDPEAAAARLSSAVWSGKGKRS